MRLITDTFAYCAEHLPNWNTISISGYHIREAGSTAVQEIAFTLANGIAYVEAALAAGLGRRRLRPAALLLLERPQQPLRGGGQVPGRPAHVGPDHDRALRREATSAPSCCASTPRPAARRSPPSSPRTTSSGSPSRRWRPCSAGPRACTPTASTRRSGCRPSEAAKIALRTQQIIGYESGVADTVDPLAGSYFVESLTDEVERRARGTTSSGSTPWAVRSPPSRPASCRTRSSRPPTPTPRPSTTGRRSWSG